MTAESRSWWNRMWGSDKAPEEHGDLDQRDTIELSPEEELERVQIELAVLAERLHGTEARADDHRCRVEELERELGSMQGEYDELARTSRDATKLIAQLRATAQSAAAERDRLEADNAELRKAVDERDRRLRLSSSELSKLRVKSKKAEAASTRHRTELDRARREAKATIAELEGQLAREVTRRDEAERTAGEAERGGTNALEALERARSVIGGLQEREEALEKRAVLVGAFMTSMTVALMDSLHACVGERTSLPLSVGWRRNPPDAQLLAADSNEALSRALAEHLRVLGIADADIVESETGVELAITLTRKLRPSDEVRFKGVATCLAQYCRAWFEATAGRTYDLTGFDTATDHGRFTATLA